MFIIDGSDGLGKTTAAKRLVELAAERARYPVRYQHMTRPNSAFDFFNDYSDMMSRYAVQDRFHLGAVAWHNPCPITAEKLHIIEGRLATLGSMMVVFFTNDADWYHRQLTKNSKVEMFAEDQIISANSLFTNIEACGSRPDRFFDVGAGEFPGDDILNFWLDEWFKRLACLPR